jgi:replicative DNA helicase
MVFSGNDIARRSNNGREKVTIDLQTLTILSKYILQSPRLLRVEHLANVRRLLNTIDYSTYENDPDKIMRIRFINKALEARLDYGLTDSDLIINHITTGIDFKVDFVDFDDYIMDRHNIEYCHKIVEETLKYAFFYTEVNNLQELITEFKAASISNKINVITKIEPLLDKIKNEFRKTHVEDNVNDVTFSLEDGTFESAITDTYRMVTNPSRRIRTGMQGFNEMIGGGFESGRVYMLLGVAGVGKSLTLLNLIKQIKKYNTNVKPKDPTKIPCIVLLTMENTVVETITRMFDMVIDDSKGMGNYELDEVIYKMREEGGMKISDSSPLDIVIRYKPNRSVSTDYLYTLYDNLEDLGKEPICIIQDHIKRIRSMDNNPDIRLELGDVVNDFKVFAAEKDIPVITVSHLNREATRILEEASRKGNQDSGKLIGKSNTGESLLMIDNLDCAITLAKDYDRDGLMYMTFHRVKMRDKGSTREYIAQPFYPDNPIKLVEDFGGIPQFKETIHDIPGMAPHTSSNIKLDSTSSINSIIDLSKPDNTFAKEEYDLKPMKVDSKDKIFNDKMDEFDKELSSLILETEKSMVNLNDTLPSEKPISSPITFSPLKIAVRPAFTINESLIKGA